MYVRLPLYHIILHVSELSGNQSCAQDSRRQVSSLQERSQHSIPDQHLIEMFSQIRNDPSFISNTSISDSFFDQTRRQSAGTAGDVSVCPSAQGTRESLRAVNQSLYSREEKAARETSLGHASRLLNEPDKAANYTSPYVPHSRLYQYDQHNSLNNIHDTRGRYSRLSNDTSRSVSYERSPGHQNSSLSPLLHNSLPGNVSRHRQPLESTRDEVYSNRYLPHMCDESMIGNVSGSGLNPVSISPLDPAKLWEESRSRLALTPTVRDYMNLPGPDARMDSSNERTAATMTLIPDEARGISHLSLSYSDVNSADNSATRHGHSSHNNSALANRSGRSKSVESVPWIQAIWDSQLLSFSDVSLQLPDGSSDQRQSYPQPDIVQSTSHRNLSNSCNTSRKAKDVFKTKSHRHASGDSNRLQSTNSLNSREYSSSYLSDRGISASERGYSSSNQTSDNSGLRSKSSGFQSDESNLSLPSPFFRNSVSHSVSQGQLQSTPLVENEITSISVPAEAILRRMSQESDVFEASPDSMPCYFGVSSLPQHPAGAMFFSEADEASQSPSLPPLRVSRRSSSAESSTSGGRRFFKDPTIDDEPVFLPAPAPDGEGGRCPSLGSLSGQQRGSSSTFLEKSSLSALLSDMSNSKCSGLQSSDETLSYSSSDPDSLRRVSLHLKGVHTAMKKAASLPYLDCNTENQRRMSDELDDGFASLPSKKRVSEYLCKDLQEKNRLQELYLEYSAASSKGLPNQHAPSQLPKEPDYVNANSLKRDTIDEYDDSPNRLDMFDRERWRNSLGSVAEDHPIEDRNKMAPKMLNQLRSKSEAQRKKVSPVNITEYTESPYKFRHGPQVCERSRAVSKDSISESLSSTGTSIHPDYENLFVQSAFLARCPLATPESLSDAAFLEDHSTALLSKTDHTLVSESKTVSEPHNESSVSDESARSVELGRTKSPINTSGINSAFRPVKRSVSPESCDLAVSATKPDATFAVPSVPAHKLLEVSSHDSLSAGERSARRSSLSQTSQGSTVSETTSSFQWTLDSDAASVGSGPGVLDTTSNTSRNYLQLAGKNALSFSMSSGPRDDSSQASKHSHSDSIPWEDSVNKSASFQNPDNVFRSSQRQPLKALDNTPVFSPIYGGEKRLSFDLLSRKRFMSTPKLSSGSEISMSRLSDDSVSLSAIRTPHRRRSSGTKRTFSDNTSTWSCQSDGDLENQPPPHDHSNLNKTTYI